MDQEMKRDRRLPINGASDVGLRRDAASDLTLPAAAAASSIATSH